MDTYFTKRKNSKGYTIIETMIAISLFLVIIMSGMGTLLNANLLHQKSQSMRSIMDSLSFVMEDLSRNLRTGYNYHCFATGDTIPSSTPTPDLIKTPKSCSNGWAIAFESDTGLPSNNDDQWVYYIDNTGKIFKSTHGPYIASAFTQMTPDEVVIDPVSGFSVLGAENQVAGNKQQPLVVIRLVGTITFKNIVTPFSIETSVSQRLIDIGSTASASLPSDTIWVDDSLPAGAISQADAFNWVNSNPSPISGLLSNLSQSNPGRHQQYFTGASSPLSVSIGDKMVAYVYLNPLDPPSEVMLQWNSGGSWEHRAYWGANSIGWGTDGTDSRRYMGALPATGQWVRLEVPASQVGLEGLSVGGMAFTLFDGQAAWDRVGKNP